MTYSSTEHPEATDELLDAISYYHGRAQIGAHFASHATRAVRDIESDPTAWPPVRDWDELPTVRSRKVRAFPYRVVYYVSDDYGIVIIAYAHERRKPRYWSARAGN